ncbi:protein kinase [Streptomyces sp. NPDC048258]|uniref:protein kinase domain-containing protein n=1 Tax=Streptomyces sp. NPDC048258 TaxID=3365527 RepID=UPI0037118168
MDGSNRGTESGALRPPADGEPREIAGYRLLARIGEGGMGSVYLSRTRGGQPVALKMIRREYAGDPDFRRRFEQEVRAARQVRGYHFVPVLDHDTQGEQPWPATAYVPGLPLDEALDTFGPLPLPAALQLVACVARALESVHAAGIVHRDLKPGNIMLAADGPWVIDFGIARAAEATRLTRSGGFIGTPQFISPEQGTGGELTAAGDVFSLGLIAAVAATGHHPYGAGGALTVATQIANTAVRPPDLSGYPDWLRPLLEGASAADPAARPAPGELVRMCEQSAGRAAADLAGWLPQPWAAAVAVREAELDGLAAAGPASAPPAYAPTYAPTQAGAGAAGSGGSGGAQRADAGPARATRPAHRPSRRFRSCGRLAREADPAPRRGSRGRGRRVGDVRRWGREGRRRSAGVEAAAQAGNGAAARAADPAVAAEAVAAAVVRSGLQGQAAGHRAAGHGRDHHRRHGHPQGDPERRCQRQEGRVLLPPAVDDLPHGLRQVARHHARSVPPGGGHGAASA